MSKNYRASASRWLAPLCAGLAMVSSPFNASSQQSNVKPTVPSQLLSMPLAQTSPQQPVAPKQQRIRQPDGSYRDLKQITATSPGFKTVLPPPLVPAQGFGREGVMNGQRVVLPFGIKGEGVFLDFHNGPFVPPANERIQPALAQLAQSRMTANGGVAASAISPSVYGIILLNGRFDDGTRARLQEMGVEVVGFYPETGLLARIPTSALNDLATLPTVRWIGQPTAAQKIHTDLRNILSAKSTKSNSPVEIWVSFFGPDNSGAMRTALSATGARLGYYDPGIAIHQVWATPTMIRQMTGMDHVLFLEPVRYGHQMSELGVQNTNADWLWGSFDPAAYATQVKIGLLDSGMYAYHTDFSNVFNGLLGYSLISGENWYDDLGLHGTHVTGTILGEGKGNFRYRGIAQEQTSHGDPYNNPDYLVAQVGNKSGSGWSGADLINGMNLLDAGSGVAGRKRQLWNASLGGYGTSGSDPESRKTDEAFTHNILPCIAAGNAGPGSGTVSTPGNAKGALTVGAVYNNNVNGYVTDKITGYSSRGPQGNGKFKPDVVAPGSYIDSVASQTANGYALDWQGTSMATPHITGIAAGLLGHWGYPAWVAKATILACAIDVLYDRNTEGLGKVDAMLGHYSIDGGLNWWWSTIGGTGSVQYVDFALGHTVAQLKIVMTYPDPPCAAGASSIMVNDLDLLVQSSNYGALTTDTGYTWRDYSTEPVSVVTLINVPAGTYRIKIHGFNVPTGSQDWGLAVKVVDSALYPTLHSSLTVPYAIQLNAGFYANASTYPDAHSATGIVGTISTSSGVEIDGVNLHRNGPSGEESWYMDAPGGPASYDMTKFDLGAAPQWYTRKADWWLKGTTEGAKTITFNAGAVNAYNSTVSKQVIVDGTPPTINSAEGVNWTQSLHCDVVATLQDTLSGINPASGWYRYSTNNGSTWSTWVNNGTSGAYGSTGVETITCLDVPFNQNNANNLIQLYVQDTAGNYTYSAPQAITTATVAALALSPSIVPGGNNVTATVTLSGAAPTGGAVVAITNTNTKASAPASMTIAGGTTSGTFTITTVGVTSTFSGTVTANYGGVAKSATLKVRPVNIKTFAFLPLKVVGAAQNSTGTITLDAVAPVNTTVTLSSSKPTVGSVPASFVISAGSTTGTFTLTSFEVAADTVVTVTAKVNGVARTANCTVTPAHLLSLTMAPNSIVGGWLTSTGTVTLDANAPSNTTVTLSSNNPSVGSVPANVVVTAGSSSATFTMSSAQVAANTVVTISAKLNAVTKNANVTVKPVVVTAVTCTPNPVKGGLNTTGKVTISGPAAPGGLVVTLGTTNAAIAAPVSGTVTVAAGATTATFTVKTHVVAANSSATISAAANGSNKTVVLKVTP